MQRVRKKQLESICSDWNAALIGLEHLWLSRNFMLKWQLWRSSIYGGLPVWWVEQIVVMLLAMSFLFFLAYNVIASWLQSLPRITVIFSVGPQFTVEANNAWMAQNLHFVNANKEQKQTCWSFNGKTRYYPWTRLASLCCPPQQAAVSRWNSPVPTAFCSTRHGVCKTRRSIQSNPCTVIASGSILFINACCKKSKGIPVSRFLVETVSGIVVF